MDVHAVAMMPMMFSAALSEREGESDVIRIGHMIRDVCEQPGPRGYSAREECFRAGVVGVLMQYFHSPSLPSSAATCAVFEALASCLCVKSSKAHNVYEGAVYPAAKACMENLAFLTNAIYATTGPAAVNFWRRLTAVLPTSACVFLVPVVPAVCRTAFKFLDQTAIVLDACEFLYGMTFLSRDSVVLRPIITTTDTIRLLVEVLRRYLHTAVVCGVVVSDVDGLFADVVGLRMVDPEVTARLLQLVEKATAEHPEEIWATRQNAVRFALLKLPRG